jgi:hypothetical protein
MEQVSASKSSTVFTYGLYFGIASILFSLITFYGGLMGNKVFSLLGYVLYPVFIFLGIKYYKDKENGGFLKYGTGLGVGVLTSVVSGVVSALFTYVFFTFIDPAKHTELIAIVQEKQLQGGVSEAQLEQMGGIMSKMMSPLMMSVFVIIGTLFWGFIFSLIIAAILKKDPEPKF